MTKPWYFRIFDRLRAWFFTLGDNWRIQSPETNIIIVMGREIERMGHSTVSERRNAARMLKRAIQREATDAGIERKLNRLVKRSIEKKSLGR